MSGESLTLLAIRNRLGDSYGIKHTMSLDIVPATFALFGVMEKLPSLNTVKPVQAAQSTATHPAGRSESVSSPRLELAFHRQSSAVQTPRKAMRKPLSLAGIGMKKAHPARMG